MPIKSTFSLDCCGGGGKVPARGVPKTINMKGKSMSSHHFLRILSRLLVIGSAAFFVGVAFSQVQPQCNNDIKENREHTNDQQGGNGNCSYSICTTGYECVSGTRYKSCGTPASDFPSYCSNYTGGDWNNSTGECEGGVLQMPFTYNGEVNGFDYPIRCGPTGIE